MPNPNSQFPIPNSKTIPGVSVCYSGSGQSTTSNAMGMRAMQSRVWQFRGEQYLLLKSPPASGKSRATRDAPGKTRARFTNLIAEPDAGEQTVSEAVNDTLKAIAASLLMEQVLAPRFEFRPKTPASTALPNLDYGPSGYDSAGCNVGVNGTTGSVQIEINGLVEPESDEATRICREDLNEVTASFVQDTRTVQNGLFNDDMPPQETTQQRMGKIVRDKYPDLSNQDQEAIRQRAIAALNLVQMGGVKAGASGSTSNTAMVAISSKGYMRCDLIGYVQTESA